MIIHWVLDHEGHFFVMSFNVVGLIMHIPMYYHHCGNVSSSFEMRQLQEDAKSLIETIQHAMWSTSFGRWSASHAIVKIMMHCSYYYAFHRRLSIFSGSLRDLCSMHPELVKKTMRKYQLIYVVDSSAVQNLSRIKESRFIKRLNHVAHKLSAIN